LLSIEIGDRSLENEFFEKNPSLGQWVSWPIIGDVIPPYDVPKEIRKWLAEHIEDWQFDQLPTTMKILNQMLHQSPTNSSKPLVIYVHCEAGKDRTGEVSGS
jgi:protein-tyrosine phosphatase